MAVIYFRGSVEDAKEAVVTVVRSVTGSSQERADLAKSVFTAIGLQALSDVKDDFVRKAQGQTGEDGITWPKLSRKYLAYGRRFGTGEAASLKRDAGLGKGNRHRGLLTKAQDKRWKQIFASRLARFAASMDIGAAKARAAQIAWATLKKEGAKTKLMVFGDRQAEILRDTGVLLNSLSPGQVSIGNSEYTPPGDQIFNLTASGVIVGTNVPYAAVHQFGSKKKGIPARPFLPTDKNPPCDAWLTRWREVAQDGIKLAIEKNLEDRSG